MRSACCPLWGLARSPTVLAHVPEDLGNAIRHIRDAAEKKSVLVKFLIELVNFNDSCSCLHCLLHCLTHWLRMKVYKKFDMWENKAHGEYPENTGLNRKRNEFFSALGVQEAF